MFMEITSLAISVDGN